MADQVADRRARTYRLAYVDGPPEEVRGPTATEAVATRQRAERPVQIIDLTAVTEWAAARQQAREDATA